MPGRLFDMRRTVALLLLLTAAVTLSAAEMSYVLKIGDDHYVTGNLDLHKLGKFTKRWSGEYLWARIEGREYLIRDNATLAEARRAWVHVEANQELYHALEAKMRPVEKRFDALEKRHDKLSDSLSDEPEDYTQSERREMERLIRELEQQMRPLEEELRELERQEEVLDDKQEVLEEAAEKKLRETIESAIRKGIAERL